MSDDQKAKIRAAMTAINAMPPAKRQAVLTSMKVRAAWARLPMKIRGALVSKIDRARGVENPARAGYGAGGQTLGPVSEMPDYAPFKSKEEHEAWLEEIGQRGRDALIAAAVRWGKTDKFGGWDLEPLDPDPELQDYLDKAFGGEEYDEVMGRKGRMDDEDKAADDPDGERGGKKIIGFGPGGIPGYVIDLDDLANEEPQPPPMPGGGDDPGRSGGRDALNAIRQIIGRMDGEGKDKKEPPKGGADNFKKKEDDMSDEQRARSAQRNVAVTRQAVGRVRAMQAFENSGVARARAAGMSDDAVQKLRTAVANGRVKEHQIGDVILDYMAARTAARGRPSAPAVIQNRGTQNTPASLARMAMDLGNKRGLSGAEREVYDEVRRADSNLPGNAVPLTMQTIGFDPSIRAKFAKHAARRINRNILMGAEVDPEVADFGMRFGGGNAGGSRALSVGTGAFGSGIMGASPDYGAAWPDFHPEMLIEVLRQECVFCAHTSRFPGLVGPDQVIPIEKGRVQFAWSTGETTPNRGTDATSGAAAQHGVTGDQFNINESVRLKWANIYTTQNVTEQMRDQHSWIEDILMKRISIELPIAIERAMFANSSDTGKLPSKGIFFHTGAGEYSVDEITDADNTGGKPTFDFLQQMREAIRTSDAETEGPFMWYTTPQVLTLLNKTRIFSDSQSPQSDDRIVTYNPLMDGTPHKTMFDGSPIYSSNNIPSHTLTGTTITAHRLALIAPSKITMGYFTNPIMLLDDYTGADEGAYIIRLRQAVNWCYTRQDTARICNDITLS